MNTIFRRLIVAVLALLAPAMLWASTDPATIKEEMEKLRRLDASLNSGLNSGGVAELLSTASREAIVAPKINSKYYAERIVKQEPALAPLEQAKRAFGFKVAQALDGVAVESQRQTTSEQRLQQATQLLDLADWFKAQKGYGNYLLVTRCENLAAVPIGYLTGDLAFPMEKIIAQRNRLMPREEQLQFRRTVLNNEAPKPFIGPLTGTQSEQDDQMQIAWGNQWHAMNDWFKARNIGIDKWKRSDLPDDLAFFLDESPSGPKTTVQSWDMDRHAGIAINGLRDKNIENIDGFAKYRELVGTFPTEPPKWWKPSDPLYSKTRAAFEDAWRPYEGKHGALFDVASIVYEQVATGRLIDQESQLDKLAAKATP